MALADFAELYGAALLQLAAIVLLLSSAWRLAGWLWPTPDLTDRLLATALVFCSLAVVLVMVLGLAGVLAGWLVAGLAAMLWLVVRATVPPAAWQPRFDVPPRLRWPLLLAVLVVLPFLARAIVWVPLAWDELTYHLYFPATWIREGRVFLVDGVYPYNYLAYYPKNHELLSTFLMVVARNDVFVKLLNLPLLALTAVAAGRLCRQLGARHTAAWCAGVFTLTMPAMFCWAATAYVEPLLNFALLAAVSFALQAYTCRRDRLWRCGVLCGLALGLAVGTKYTALYLAVFLVLAVLAVPLLRRLDRRAGLVFAGSFLAASLTTGIWWYAINAIETGNPVYPVALEPLNAIDDPDRQGILDSNILTDFRQLWSEGYLATAWFGQPPGEHKPWAVGPHLRHPTYLGFGLKLFAIAPLALAGLVLALRRTLRRGAGPRRFAAMIVAGAMLVMLYTYLKLPIWGDPENIYWQVRFAAPFACLAVALGFAALAATPVRHWLPALAVGGLACDALLLDLRLPGQERMPSQVLLAALGSGVVMLRQVRLPARAVWRLAALLIALALLPLLALRERDRYVQWFSCSEVHGTLAPAFIEAADLLDHQHPGQKVAYAGDFASFLYLLVGPRFDREVCYVPTQAGAAPSHANRGKLRCDFDRTAWEENLSASGAQFLICLRLHDRQVRASYHWPAEADWADDLHFPLLVDNGYCRLYRVAFAPATTTGEVPAVARR